MNTTPHPSATGLKRLLLAALLTAALPVLSQSFDVGSNEIGRASCRERVYHPV